MTENDQKQQLSIAYVHAVAARAGFACQLIHVDDDSVDVQLAAKGMIDKRSIYRSPKIDVQLKATSQNVLKETHLAFPLPIKNYNDLRQLSFLPRLLVVLYLPGDKKRWLEQTEDQMISRHCAYWLTLLGEPETENRKNITVHVPREQQLTVSSLRSLMEKVARKEPL